MSDKNTHKKIKASIAVIKNGEHLLFQKRKKSPYANHLGLLGGKIEKGETAKQALAREILEESGLKLENLIYLGEVKEMLKKQNSTLSVVLAVFQGEAADKERALAEEGELKWVHVNKLESVRKEFIPTDWIIVKKAINGGMRNFQIEVKTDGNTYELVKTE